jgi:hypothetical protein
MYESMSYRRYRCAAEYGIQAAGDPGREATSSVHFVDVISGQHSDACCRLPCAALLPPTLG